MCNTDNITNTQKAFCGDKLSQHSINQRKVTAEAGTRVHTFQYPSGYPGFKIPKNPTTNCEQLTGTVLP